MVSVVQRAWAATNPRAALKTPITIENVLASRMVAYPFRSLQCCLVTDGGGALILTAAERQELLHHTGDGGIDGRNGYPACAGKTS